MTARSTALALVAGAALTLAPAGASAAETCAGPAPGGDWPMYGGALESHRSQAAETTIGPANVASLTLAWKVAMPDGGKIQSVPTEADGCVFTGTDIGGVVAINAATGKIVWQRKLSDDGSGSSPFVGAGLIGAPAIANGLVYVGVTTSDATEEIALDEATGEVVWSKAVDKDPGGGADSSPVPFDFGGGQMLFQSYQGDESSPHSNPGYVVLDALTGDVLVSKKMIPAADYAAGDRGGSMTVTPALDPVRKRAYAGTGNPANPRRNPVTDAQVEIDLDPASPTFGDILGKVAGDSETYPLPDTDSPVCDHSLQWPVSIVTCLQTDMDFLSSGNLYTAANGHRYYAEIQKSGVVHTIDTTTMRTAWTATIGVPCLGCNLGSSATDGKSVFVATTDGNLFSLNGDDGSIQWAAPLTGTWHFNGVSYANGVVYDLNDAGFLEAFNAADGTPLLVKSLGLDDQNPGRSDGENSAGISIARNTVFVPSNSQTGGGSTLFAYRLGAGGGSGGPGLPPLPAPPSGGGNGGQIVSTAGAQNYGYATPVAVISKGGSLSYTNLDPVQHNVVARDKGADGKPLFASDFAGLGQTVPVKGAEALPAGQYAFYCTLHTGMQGTLIVQ